MDGKLKFMFQSPPTRSPFHPEQDQIQTNETHRYPFLLRSLHPRQVGCTFAPRPILEELLEVITWEEP